MFHAFAARTAAAVHVLLGALRTRTAAAPRGVTFIEYALLAAVAVVIGVIFRNVLSDAFTNILNRIKNGVA